jgi:hypothetical protein
MLNIYKIILVVIVASFLTTFGFFVFDIIGIINLSGLIKIFVYVSSIILILNVLFVLLLLKKSSNQYKANETQ